MKAIIVTESDGALVSVAVVNDGDEDAAVARLKKLTGDPLEWTVRVFPVEPLADVVEGVEDARKQLLQDMAEDGERAAGWDGSR